MSNLNEQILNELKQAMRDKNQLVLSVLRMLISAIKNKKIELNIKEDLSDEQVIAVISSEIKKRNDSIKSYIDGGREDLADAEKKELEVLKKYQPEQMSEEEIEKIVKETVEPMGEVGPSDFGKVMGAIMPKVKGKADGNQVTGIVKKILEA